MASNDLFRPSEVVNLVAERLPHRFTMDTHTRCWRYFDVRPATGAGEPEATDDRYCRWDRLLNGYGYTKAWIEKLVRELSDPSKYAAAVGFSPDRLIARKAVVVNPLGVSQTLQTGAQRACCSRPKQTTGC